jgi:hypothetical protein
MMAREDSGQEPVGMRRDDVSSYPATEQQIQTYRDAMQALDEFQVPVLIHADNPHERLFVASFDGTGNSKYKDPEHETNVGKISDQVEALCGTTSMCGFYLEGPGTQDNFLVRTWDGARGGSYDERLERMYDRLVSQAKVWRSQDPDVQIRVADIGFSRGAEQAAGFARMVHERGIVDPADPTRHIVPPGQVAQVEGLFDPVGTGIPYERDRRPPPSVLSTFQVTALDERRGLFKTDFIAQPGLSGDGRSLNVGVAGAHSDIGGGYYLKGLAVRNSNLMTDYLNALSDRPLLQRQAELVDPSLNVVHRSEEGMVIYRYGSKVDRQQPEGQHPCAGPQPNATPASAACRVEARDEMMNQSFERRAVGGTVTPFSSTHDLFEALSGAAMRGDWNGMRAVEQTYLSSPDGQGWLMQGQRYNQQLQEQQAAQEAQQRATMQQQMRQGPVM